MKKPVRWRRRPSSGRRLPSAAGWKRKTRAAAALQDKGRVLQRVEDAFHRILHGEDEACGKLARSFPGIHQGRRIRQETKRGEHLKEYFLPVEGVLAVKPFGRRDRPGDPPEHLFRRLHGVTRFVLEEIAHPEQPQGVFREFDHNPMLTKFPRVFNPNFSAG